MFTGITLMKQKWKMCSRVLWKIVRVEKEHALRWGRQGMADIFGLSTCRTLSLTRCL